MREAEGDIWEQRADVVVITTNGSFTVAGEAIMGRGVALQAKLRYPGLPRILGSHINQNGNVPAELIRVSPLLGHGEASSDPGPFSTSPRQFRIWSWPVKHRWKEMADVRLINSGAYRLLAMADRLEEELRRIPTIVVPRPGCGNGGLLWTEVRSYIEPVLDDRFIVVHREEAQAV